MDGKGDVDASDMQLRPRFCNGRGQGVRGPDASGSDWTRVCQRGHSRFGTVSFRPSCVPQLGLTYEQKRSRCKLRGTARVAFPQGAAQC